MKYAVYALIDPTEHVVFYVGYSRDMEKAISDFRTTGEGPVGKRVQQTHNNSSWTVAIRLNECTSEAKAKREKIKWLRMFRRGGAPLLNRREPGEHNEHIVGTVFGDVSGREDRIDDLVELGYHGDWDSIERKYGMNQEEFNLWKKETCPNEGGDYDELEGFGDD